MSQSLRAKPRKYNGLSSDLFCDNKSSAKPRYFDDTSFSAVVGSGDPKLYA